MIAFGSGESGGDGSPPGSSGGRGRSVSKCRVLCSFSFFTGFEGRDSFGLNNKGEEKKKINTYLKDMQIKLYKEHYNYNIWLLKDYEDFTFEEKNNLQYNNKMELITA